MRIDLDKQTLEKMWLEFDWASAEYELLEMQKNLTKVTFARNKDAIREWQNKIVTSVSAKALAVRHVCNSFTQPGVDGVAWRSASDRMNAALTLTSLGYKSKPTKRIVVQEKFSGKERYLSVHTCYDKAMQVLYAYSLAPIAEARADFKSFAFRKGHSAADAHVYLMNALNFKGAPEYVLYADVKACYNSISHRWLMERIPMEKSVLAEFLSAGFVFAGEIFPSEDHGISLGANISTYLGNMTLDGLGGYIYKSLYGRTVTDYSNGDVLRFADDIIVTARSVEDAYRIKNVISDFLAPRGLVLSSEKTKVVHVNEGFNFLSRHYIKRNGIMCASPSKKAVDKLIASLSETILSHTGSQKALIDTVNRKLGGWANYHKICNATDEFRKVDVAVQALLLRASEAKHPKLSRERVISKYWYKDLNNDYVYALPTKKECQIIKLADTVLTEHRPVKLERNPYLDQDYFDARSEVRKLNNITDEFKAIWNRQNGCCFYCGRPILADHERKTVKINVVSRKAVAKIALVHLSCANDEFAVYQTEKNSEHFSRLELFNLIDEMKDAQSKAGRKLLPAYAKLSNYFLAQTCRTVTMTFKQIETIIGKPLAPSAYKDTKYWYKNDKGTLSHAWNTQGYSIQSIQIPEQKVIFTQTEAAKSQVIIPEVFLSQKIPKDAKFEIESFFEYIRKKYGI